MEAETISAGGDAKPTNGDTTEVTGSTDNVVKTDKLSDNVPVKKELDNADGVKELDNDSMDTHEDTAEKSKPDNKKTTESDKDDAKKDVDEADEESEDEESDEEEIVPLLEREPEVTGKRERKTVERFVTAAEKETKRRGQMEEGSGVRLGDCPVIEHNISHGKQEDIHMLHQAIFYRIGRPHEFRKNLRNFRGFPFAIGSAEYTKRKEKMETYRMDVLKQLARILDLDRKNGLREEMAVALIDFLCNPKPSGRAVSTPAGKRRSTGAGSAKKGSAKKSTPGGSGKRGRPRKVQSNDADIDDAIESALRGGSGDDSDDEPPPKKSPKKAPAKKTPKKTPAKSPKKTTKKKKGEAASSDDDESLSKKASKPPTDGEIRSLVRRLLDGANLEEVTMKTVLTKVYNKYPQHDLTARKDFIKQTVKALIS